MTKNIAKKIAALVFSLMFVMPVSAAQVKQPIVNKYDKAAVVEIYRKAAQDESVSDKDKELVANYFINECRVLWGIEDEIKYIPGTRDKEAAAVIYGQVTGDGFSGFGLFDTAQFYIGEIVGKTYVNYQMYASKNGIQNAAVFMYQQVELIKSMPKVMPKGFPWDEDPSSQEFMLSSLPQAHNILTKFLKDNKLSGDYEFRMPGKLTFENGQIINNYTTKYIEYEDLPEVYKEYTSFMYDFEDLIEWNLKNLKPSHLEGAFPMANYFYKAVNGKVVAKTPDEILEYANAKIAAAATQKEKDEINNFVRNIGTIYRLYIDRDVSSALKRFKDGSIDKPVFDLADPNDPYYIVKTKLK